MVPVEKRDLTIPYSGGQQYPKISVDCAERVYRPQLKNYTNMDIHAPKQDIILSS
jgi:hypothetical protein